MSGNSIILHKDSLIVLDDLTDQQAGQLFKAIRAYHEGREVELDPLLRMAFLPFKNQFIRDQAKYAKVVERNQKNGKSGANKRWKAKNSDRHKSLQLAPTGPQSGPDIADSKNKKDSKKDSDTYTEFLGYLNSLLSKKFLGDKKSRVQYRARIKEGRTLQDFKTAILNASKDKYHSTECDPPFKYLTPEFITRADKLEKFLNATPVLVQPQNDLRGYTADDLIHFRVKQEDLEWATEKRTALLSGR